MKNRQIPQYIQQEIENFAQENKQPQKDTNTNNHLDTATDIGDYQPTKVQLGDVLTVMMPAIIAAIGTYYIVDYNNSVNMSQELKDILTRSRSEREKIVSPYMKEIFQIVISGGVGMGAGFVSHGIKNEYYRIKKGMQSFLTEKKK